MHVREIITQISLRCRPDTSVQEAAKLMMENDCGEIPVIGDSGFPVGVITDRDIAYRCVAPGKSLDTCVSDVMSSPTLTALPVTSIAAFFARMEENQNSPVSAGNDRGGYYDMESRVEVARG